MVSGTAARESAEAIRRELAGLNAIVDVYGNGSTPRYPQIDGPIGKKSSERLAADVAVAALISETGRDEAVAALDSSIGLALALLDVNDRLDAIAFEPIDGGLNADAFRRARTLNWSRYPNTAVIVRRALIERYDVAGKRDRDRAVRTAYDDESTQRGAIADGDEGADGA